jgi:hypothetical protein
MVPIFIWGFDLSYVAIFEKKIKNKCGEIIGKKREKAKEIVSDSG